MRQRTTAKYVISSQTCLMIAVKCLRLPWARITIDIWRWQSWTFSLSWNSWAQYMQLNLHSQYCPHVHAVPCIDLIGSFLQCHALVFNIWVTIWLWRDGRYETTNLAANCSDNTKMTTPKFPRANRSRCAWATKTWITDLVCADRDSGSITLWGWCRYTHFLSSVLSQKSKNPIRYYGSISNLIRT